MNQKISKQSLLTYSEIIFSACFHKSVSETKKEKNREKEKEK